MRFNFRHLLSACAFALAATATSASAQTAIRYSNWLPPAHSMRVDVIEPWIADVEKVTAGRVKINTIPKVVGAVRAQFDVAKDGQADLVLFVPGYTPGRFDILEAAQLPFLGDDPEKIAPAVDRNYRKHMAQYGELKGVHPLSVFVVSPGQLFNKVRPLKTIADFKGLKMRSPQVTANQALTLLGAIPVTKPVSETYELLSSGVLDGTFMPAESIGSFKLTDLVPYTTIVPGAIYNTVLIFGINEDKWNSISQADRDAITKISGDVFARSVGRAYAKGDKAVYDTILKSGRTIETLSPAVVTELKTLLQPIERDWAEKAKKKGVADPQKLLEQLRAEIAASK
jgi:TRAP-type C4-dicarboxylate transport system substrate-binding protein